ncbi:MAG: PadR family transcriptional regulator [Paludibacteraceae bacterium]|nr:PadR family transcriptional regulator [Paludibacteraceae bacterium]
MVENIKSQMRKGILEYCILSVISRQEAYTSDILEALKQADLLVVEGTLYPLLTRMKNNGLLAYRWQESTDGPPRKYFCLTEDGREMLNQMAEEWQAVSRSIELITGQN